jgi:ubiquinone/menaquinone biosynthesis C-methylase UbiE
VPIPSRASREVEHRLRRGQFRCPGCQSNRSAMKLNNDGLNCENCGADYPLVDGVLTAMPATEGLNDKENIRRFWHELYEAAYAGDNAGMSREELVRLLEDLELLFRRREHLAVCEMPLAQLRDAEVLEIGTGNGAHSALFAFRHGARMTSVDLTPSRVLATSAKLDTLLPDGNHLCLQADAESLPFSDEAFDIVYSNGVLHHTNDTEKAIREIFRVLRPGGSAVIMLYAKHSFQYWIGLVIGHGIIKGEFLRGRNWIGRSTEWMSEKQQTVLNPITRVYSEQQIRSIFANFSEVKVRKNSFQWRLIPGLERVLERTVLRGSTKFEGGRLVYGFPYRPETRTELWLGRHIGFGLNIFARK